MTSPLIFTWKDLELQLSEALDSGYTFHKIVDWYRTEALTDSNLDHKICLRIDVDLYPEKVAHLQNILSRLEIEATFFIRLHSATYNPLSLACLNPVQGLVDEGHEVGLHHEAIDFCNMVQDRSSNPLVRQLDLFESIYGFRPYGVAGHGGSTGFNNQDVFKNMQAKDFGLIYEAYDASKFGIFSNSRFVSDSLWTEWKSYENGQLQIGDKRTLGEHIKDNPKLLYVLIHPDTFYFSYPYESFR